MDATEIIKSLTDLRDRAERAEALLADESNRVENLRIEARKADARILELEAELAGRPVVTEEQITEIALEMFPPQSTEHDRGSVLMQIIRKHIDVGIGAKFESKKWEQWSMVRPVVGRIVEYRLCNWDDVRCGTVVRAESGPAIRDLGDGKIWDEIVDTWRFAERLRLPATPEPVPDGVWWWNDIAEAFFNRIGNDTIGYYEGSSFQKKWHSRRHEFPQSREEAERRQKQDEPDLVMALIHDLRNCDDSVARGSIAHKLREKITKEREAGR